jgi:hypothetical protein
LKAARYTSAMRVARLVIASACLAVAPVAADADATSLPEPVATAAAAPGMPLPSAPGPGFEMHMRAVGERFASQLHASQSALRRNVLAMLTPAQRAMVAAAIGRLAVSNDADVPAAIRQIDAALSPAQRQSIKTLAVAEAIRREVLFFDMIKQSQSEFAHQAPSSDDVKMQSGEAFAMPGGFTEAMRTQSAATLLLQILTVHTMSAMSPQPLQLQVR